MIRLTELQAIAVHLHGLRSIYLTAYPGLKSGVYAPASHVTIYMGARVFLSHQSSVARVSNAKSEFTTRHCAQSHRHVETPALRQPLPSLLVEILPVSGLTFVVRLSCSALIELQASCSDRDMQTSKSCMQQSSLSEDKMPMPRSRRSR